MIKTTAQVLDELFDYLGDERWELADILLDVTQGCVIAVPETKKLLKNLFDSMPSSDALEVADIHRNIKAVGSTYALRIARDLADYAELCHEHSSDVEVCEAQH